MSSESATNSERIGTDPVIGELRQQLSDIDRRILRLFNRRLALVRQIRSRKDALGIPFLDPAREDWMLRDLTHANYGQLTTTGLAELHKELLALTKRELERTVAN